MIETEHEPNVKSKNLLDYNKDQGLNNVYERSDYNISKLKRDIEKNKIVLFLGAGVSMDFKTPSWNQLLERLFSDKKIFNVETKKVWKAIKKNVLGGKLSDVLQQGRMIELQCQVSKVDFKAKVKKHIYNKNTTNNDPNATLNLIGEFFFNKLDSIVTFNFDDYAEKKLDEYQKKYKTIHKEEDLVELKFGEFPVYHPHGFLPSGKVDVSGNEYSIVFSETAYHQTYSEPYSWSNLVQINKLTNCTCIFIGISLSDPNMRRLLDVAKKTNPSNEHYLICTKNKSMDEILNTTVDGSFESYAKSLNVYTIYIESFKEPLRKLFNNLTKK